MNVFKLFRGSLCLLWDKNKNLCDFNNKISHKLNIFNAYSEI